MADVVTWPDLSAPPEEPIPTVTEEELAEIREAARLEGFKAGHTEGMAKAREEIDGQLCEERASVQQAIGQLTHLLTDTEEAMTRALAEYLRELCCTVLNHELRTNGDWWLARVEEARVALNETNLTVYHHPEDGRWLAEPGREGLKLIEDKALARGTLRAEAPLQALKFDPMADLQTALDSIEEQALEPEEGA